VKFRDELKHRREIVKRFSINDVGSTGKILIVFSTVFKMP